MNQPNQQQQGQQQGRRGQQQQKKRINRVFELVGKHAADEFAKWQEERDITPQVLDELATADFDAVDRAFKTGDFKGACRAVIGITCERLIREDKLEPGDPSCLEEVFKKMRQKIEEEQQERKKKEEEAKKKKEEKPSPLPPLSSEEKAQIQKAFALVIRKEREKVNQWTASCLDEVQRLVFSKALANMDVAVGAQAIRNMAMCADNNAITTQAKSSGLLQIGNPLIIAQSLAAMDAQKSALLSKHLAKLSTVQTEQLVMGLNALDDKQRTSLLNLLAVQKFQQFLTACQRFNLIS